MEQTKQNTMKTNDLQKAYTNFKLELTKELSKARAEYKRNKGINHEKVIELSSTLATISELESKLK